MHKGRFLLKKKRLPIAFCEAERRVIKSLMAHCLDLCQRVEPPAPLSIPEHSAQCRGMRAALQPPSLSNLALAGHCQRPWVRPVADVNQNNPYSHQPESFTLPKHTLAFGSGAVREIVENSGIARFAFLLLCLDLL